MTEGERRIYHWISDRVSNDKGWRGCYTLVVTYKTPWPVCECCGQHVRINPDIAYRMFCDASLKWNDKDITHEQLRTIILGIPGGAVDSKSGFRNPASYGLDPFREWGRKELGRSIVLIDLDIAVRRYGNRFGLDADGDLMLIEKKERWP